MIERTAYIPPKYYVRSVIGLPADLFIGAHEAGMTPLLEDGSVSPNTIECRAFDGSVISRISLESGPNER